MTQEGITSEEPGVTGNGSMVKWLEPPYVPGSVVRCVMDITCTLADST